MTHRQVFEVFKRLFSTFIDENLLYFPNGRNSIRIRGIKGFNSNGQDVIFSINGREWRLESVGSFLKAWKEDKQ